MKVRKIAERIMALDYFVNYEYIDNGNEDVEKIVEEKPLDIIEWLLDCIEDYELYERGNRKEETGVWLLPDKYYDKKIFRKCSVCNEHYDVYRRITSDKGYVRYAKRISDYCPSCGKRMKGEQK